MATPVDKSSLSRQISADPRVQQWIAQRYPRGTRGSPEIPAELLQQWGYQIPEGHGVAVMGKGARVYDKFDKYDAIIGGVAGTGVGLGIGGLLGVGPLAGGGAGAGGSAAAGAGGAAGAGTAAGVGAGAAAGAAQGATKSLTDKGIDALISAAFAGLAGLTNKGPSDEERALYAQARQMAELQQRRISYQNPLYESVTRLAMNRLPTNVQNPLGTL